MTLIPAVALMLWAVAIMLGAPHELLRVVGSAVLTLSIVAHIHWEVRDRN